MDFNILESLGKIAGIAGIGFGIIALIFGSIIQKKIFPKLNQKQSFSIIRTIIFLSFTIAILGLVSWMYTSNAKEKEKSVKALRIIGQVNDAEGNPAKGVKAYFKQDQDNFDKTDNEGKFIIEVKGSGSQFYDLILFHEEYNNYDKNVEIDFSDSDGKIELKSFSLTPANKVKRKKDLSPNEDERVNNTPENEPKTKATINIIYNGDALGCLLTLNIKIANKVINPTVTRFKMTDIPVGNQNYSIEGNINCGLNGSCYTSGNGTIFIEEGMTYYLVWLNQNLDNHCDISLVPQNEMNF